jgi:HSP20 family protein
MQDLEGKMGIRDLAPHRSRRDPEVASADDHPVSMLQREMGQLIDDFFHDFRPFGEWPGDRGGNLVPRVDISETDSEITVEAELPGMIEKDIEVSVSDDALTIKGEKKAESEKKEKQFVRTERSFGRIERTIPIHEDILADKVSARFDKGVLSVTLPKAPEARKKVKKIAVASGASK